MQGLDVWEGARGPENDLRFIDSNQVCPGGFGGVVDSNLAILRR